MKLDKTPTLLGTIFAIVLTNPVPVSAKTDQSWVNRYGEPATGGVSNITTEDSYACIATTPAGGLNGPGSGTEWHDVWWYVDGTNVYASKMNDPTGKLLLLDASVTRASSERTLLLTPAGLEVTYPHLAPISCYHYQYSHGNVMSNPGMGTVYNASLTPIDTPPLVSTLGAHVVSAYRPTGMPEPYPNGNTLHTDSGMISGTIVKNHVLSNYAISTSDYNHQNTHAWEDKPFAIVDPETTNPPVVSVRPGVAAHAETAINWYGTANSDVITMKVTSSGEGTCSLFTSEGNTNTDPIWVVDGEAVTLAWDGSKDLDPGEHTGVCTVEIVPM